MTASVVIPVTIRVEGDSGVYEVAAAQVVLGANGANVALLSLAVGRSENGRIQQIGFVRGQIARVVISRAKITSSTAPLGIPVLGVNSFLGFTSENFVLFEGVVDDFGPGSLSAGEFSVVVRLVSRLGVLASGTLSTSNVMPKSYWDTTVMFAYGEGKLDNEFVIDPELGTVNLWEGLQDALLQTALYVPPEDAPVSEIARIVSRVFGTDVNAKAAEVLSDMDGQLMFWNTDRTETERAAIIYNINQALSTSWSYAPFLQRVLGVGDMLGYAVIEIGREIKVVPYEPFFRRTDAYPITPDSYSQLSPIQGPVRNCAGVVWVDSESTDAGDPAVGASVLGFYKMRGDGLGMVHTAPLPGYLGEITEDMYQGGEKVRSFDAVKAPIEDMLVASSLLNTNAYVTNLLAKYQTWKLNYQERNLQVSCPMFRADIGPLEAVRIDFPSTVEISAALETPAVYGSVQRVTIQIDCTKGYANTVYDVGYVRSFSQQKSQIDPDIEDPNEHPFFNTNYIGGRLDTPGDRRSPSA